MYKCIIFSRMIMHAHIDYQKNSRPIRSNFQKVKQTNSWMYLYHSIPLDAQYHYFQSYIVRTNNKACIACLIAPSPSGLTPSTSGMRREAVGRNAARAARASPKTTERLPPLPRVCCPTAPRARRPGACSLASTGASPSLCSFI